VSIYLMFKVIVNYDNYIIIWKNKPSSWVVNLNWTSILKIDVEYLVKQIVANYFRFSMFFLKYMVSDKFNVFVKNIVHLFGSINY